VIGFFLEGYGWLPNRRRRARDHVVGTRMLGRRVTALCGPDAARFFYDEANIRRHDVVPGPVQDTLFGRGGPPAAQGDVPVVADR
jgi:fatty-acid peroxygenase